MARLLLGGFLQAMARGALGDTRRLAAPAAQVIELGPADIAAADQLDRVQARAVEREYALDPFAVGGLADREGRVDAGSAPGDAPAFESLDALARALDHLHIVPDRIAGRKGRD